MAKFPKGRKLKIALSTGGGDAPGLNAVIRPRPRQPGAWAEVWGIQEG